MEKTKQQIANLINSSKNILIAPPENLSGDALASGLALTDILNRLGKNSNIIIPEKLPEKFNFLSKINPFSSDQIKEREFILSIKNKNNHINNLSYKKEGDLLHIYLKAKDKIEEKDLRIKYFHSFDLIFTIKNQEYKHIGKAFDYNPDLFFETPIINIDNHPDNERFGQINLIDITSSSVSEIILDLIDFIDRSLLDKEVATKILAGLIEATNNFQSTKINPKAFNNAALLINRGGDQQKIIRNLYKTRPLNFIQLWGRVLRKISTSPKQDLVWARITQKDFKKTNTCYKYIPQIFEEIKKAFLDMVTSFIIWPNSSNQEIKGAIFSTDSELLTNLKYKLKGKQDGSMIFFKIKKTSSDQVEHKILNLIKQAK